jgi:hypothetical protein
MAVTQSEATQTQRSESPRHEQWRDEDKPYQQQRHLHDDLDGDEVAR